MTLISFFSCHPKNTVVISGFYFLAPVNGFEMRLEEDYWHGESEINILSVNTFIIVTVNVI